MCCFHSLGVCVGRAASCVGGGWLALLCFSLNQLEWCRFFTTATAATADADTAGVHIAR